MPDIVVVGPDGNEYVFPDGTSDEVMRKAMRERFPPPKKEKEKLSRTEAVLSGVERGLKPISEFARSINPLEYIGDVVENYFFPGLELRRAEREARRAALGEQAQADQPNYFLGGKIGGEIAGTVPLLFTGGGLVGGAGRGLTRLGGQMATQGVAGGRVAQASGRVLEAGARAFQTGGIGVRAPSRAAIAARAPMAATLPGRVALRAGGGGAAGVAAAALTDQDITDAAMAGAVLPLAGTVARQGVGFIYDVLRQRVGEVRAAEIMRNLIASNLSAIADALRNAPENVRANTAQFLASQGLLTPELAAATNVAAASSKNAPLLAVEEARGLGQADMLRELGGGRNRAEAMENINAMRAGVRATAEPLRQEAMRAANVGRNVIRPLEQQARAFEQGASDINQSGIVRRMRGLEGRTVEQMEDVFAHPELYAPGTAGRQLPRLGEIADQAGQRADEGINTQLFMRDQAAAARAIADDLRAQGFGPIDISPIVGRMRELAREALPGSDRRKLFSGFADMLEARAAEKGGVIDAEGLHLAKREMNEFVARVLGQTDPSALKRGTSMMLGASQKLIDDALNEAAGPGSPFAKYNRVFSEGMKRVEQQEFALALAGLTPKRFERVLNNEDPDFIREFFPDKFRIEDVLSPQQMDTARRLNSEIAADLDVAATGLRNLPTASRAKYGTGVRESVREAMQPGMKNAFARFLIRQRQTPGTSMAISSDQIAGGIANEIQERAMRHLVPALASPQAASRLLAQRSSSNVLAGMVNRAPPSVRLAGTQAAQRFQSAPAATPAPAGMFEGTLNEYDEYGNPLFDEQGNWIGPRR